MVMPNEDSRLTLQSGRFWAT